MGARWKNRSFKRCACGCGGLTRATWSKGHWRPGLSARLRARETRAVRQRERRLSWEQLREWRRQLEDVVPGDCHRCAVKQWHKGCTGWRQVGAERVAAPCRCYFSHRAGPGGGVREWRADAFGGKSEELTALVEQQQKDDASRGIRGARNSEIHLDDVSQTGACRWDLIPTPSGDADEALAQLTAERLLMLPTKHPVHAVVQAVVAGEVVPDADRERLRQAYGEARRLVLAPRATKTEPGWVTSGSMGGGGWKRGRGRGGHGHSAHGRHEGTRQIQNQRALREARRLREIA